MYFIARCRDGSRDPAFPEDFPLIDFAALTAFVAIAEAQSIGCAANRLGISQPALSRRIQDLEDHVGVRSP